MAAIAIGWQKANYKHAEHDCAEVDHDGYPHTMCAWIEKLQNCPFERWIFSVDIPDMKFVDKSGYPLRVRALASGFAYSRAEAVSAVEEAIQRLVGGLVVVS